MNWSDKRVLVTGGASFIGSHLVERLLQKGAANVRVADNLSSGKLENLLAVQNDIDFLKGDLRDTSAAQNATRGCDVVFHLAADHGGRGYISSHPASCAGNMALDNTVFRAAVNNNAERILFASSACVYPTDIQTGKVLLREDFQYDQTQISANQILDHTAALLSPGQPIYIATDEIDSAFLDIFREQFTVVTFGGLPEEIVDNIPDHWCGIIETLICAAAPGRFIGTRLSTFSSRIATLRGHLSHTKGSDCEAIDSELHYTQPPLYGKTGGGLFARYWRTSEKQVDQLGETGIPWWLSKDPIWGRAYQACKASSLRRAKRFVAEMAANLSIGHVGKSTAQNMHLSRSRSSRVQTTFPRAQRHR